MIVVSSMNCFPETWVIPDFVREAFEYIQSVLDDLSDNFSMENLIGATNTLLRKVTGMVLNLRSGLDCQEPLVTYSHPFVLLFVF